MILPSLDCSEHLRDASKILVDITATERRDLEQAMITGRPARKYLPLTYVVGPDEEHMIWPFDGEYWRDELGYYRQVVVNICTLK